MKIKLLMYLLLFQVLVLFFSYNSFASSTKETIIERMNGQKTVTGNIERNLVEISNDVNEKLNGLYNDIDHEIDVLFRPIFLNIDSYLNFHFSIIGEYVELSSAAQGKLLGSINNRLMGKNFDMDFKNSLTHLDSKFEGLIIKHLKEVNYYANQDIDIELNQNMFAPVYKNIKDREVIQKVKSGVLAGVAGTAIGTKIVAAVSAKVIAKLAAKTAVKTGTKLATASTAAATGVFCGPLVWVCAPLFAGTVWFGTDALVVSVDEKLHRKELRNEIDSALLEVKRDIKIKAKEQYKENFEKFSQSVLDAFTNTDITIRKIPNEQHKMIDDIFK